MEKRLFNKNAIHYFGVQQRFSLHALIRKIVSHVQHWTFNALLGAIRYCKRSHCQGNGTMHVRWRLNLNKKLFFLVAMATVLMAAVMGVGISSYTHMEKSNRFKSDMYRVAAEVLSTRVAEKIYLQFRTAETKKNFDSMAQKVKSKIEVLKYRKTDGKWMEHIVSMEKMFQEYQLFLDELMQILNAHSDLKARMTIPIAASEKVLTDMVNDLLDKKDELLSRSENMSTEDNDMLNLLTDCRTSLLQLQILQLQFLFTGDEKSIQEYRNLSNLTTERYIGQLEHYASISENTSFTRGVAQVKKSLGEFLQAVDLSKELYDKEKAKTKMINDLGENIIASTDAMMGEIDRSIAEKKRGVVIFLSAMVCIGMLLFWFFSFVLVRAITRPIRNVITGLTESARQVASSSSHVSASSRHVADGTSEQAASIEETSSSLEEMSSMTQQNAENTKHVDLLMKETKEIVAMANSSVKELNAAMEEIVSASDETSKIVKSIDAIAFQTNLLALNAAVEAARAGEGGAGFAVVSDEVRRLALRAGDAAKNTAHLIESTVIRIREGVEIARKTEEGFSRGGDIIAKIGELVREITEASNAQAQGIEEINRAVYQIEKVVQENATHADQSAAASNDMTTQFQQLNAFVEQLSGILHGRSDRGEKQISTDFPAISIIRGSFNE
jgi:methyl-accepting chemotaxis protein